MNKQATLGTFKKLRKLTIGFVVSVCPSLHSAPVSMKKLGPTGRIFMKFDT